jgi:hypothetical protein
MDKRKGDNDTRCDNKRQKRLPESKDTQRMRERIQLLEFAIQHGIKVKVKGLTNEELKKACVVYEEIDSNDGWSAVQETTYDGICLKMIWKGGRPFEFPPTNLLSDMPDHNVSLTFKVPEADVDKLLSKKQHEFVESIEQEMKNLNAQDVLNDDEYDAELDKQVKMAGGGPTMCSLFDNMYCYHCESLQEGEEMVINGINHRIFYTNYVE